MGWTSQYTGFRSNDNEKVKDFLIKQWHENGHFEVLDYSRKGKVVYMAIKNRTNNDVFAAVTLINFQDGEFFWKEMTEHSGPCYVECPKRILKKLSPTNDPLANKWRQQCLELHETNRLLNKIYSMGDIVEFDRDITFTDGFCGKRFIVFKWNRSTLFAPYTGQNNLKGVFPKYRITRWKLEKPKVIGHLED